MPATMTDAEAAAWREELAAETPASAPSPAVPRRKQAAPWYSTPAAKRRSKPRNLTLTPEAHDALDRLASRPGGDSASAEASAAIVERATRLGVWPPPPT